jgi:predicted nucleic acid-binding protein
MPDDHSAKAAALIVNLAEPVTMSSLVALECVNAMQLRSYRKERTPRQTTDSIDAFESDLAADVFRLFPVPPASWQVAQRLSRSHSSALGTRCLDILQVAIALALRAGTFLTFDRNQAALAQAEGLRTHP